MATLLLNTAGAQTLSPVIYKAGYEALASFGAHHAYLRCELRGGASARICR